MARQTSQGICNLCGGYFSKSSMTKHLMSCKQKQADSATSTADKVKLMEQVFHLVVEGRYSPAYWMHLEVPANAKLELLDRFLRDIWLECCGHLSAFDIEGQRYSVYPMEDFNEKSMKTKLDELLIPGLKFSHEYDFGSTTYLQLRVVSKEIKKIKDKSIEVLARNEPPSYPCESCDKVATLVCPQCIYSGEGCLCDKCAAEHECGEDILLPIVNSPRVGVCGYTGD